jgi:hypothetical protein
MITMRFPVQEQGVYAAGVGNVKQVIEPYLGARMEQST